MASFRKRGKIWHYRYVDADGVQRERKGCPDRRETEGMAAALEAEAAKVRAGLIDPRADAYRRHEAKPLSAHMDDFHADMIARGGTAKHADLHAYRARRVAEVARLDRLGDLSASRVQGALAALRTEGLSLATVNHHRAAIRGFSRWLWKDGRLRDDPLIGVGGFNAKEDRRRDRRTIGLGKLRILIAKAHDGPAYRKMTGPARALCYRLAVSTGLRYAEIQSITPGSFDWGTSPATVSVPAGYTKNGEPATLPLPCDVAVDLRCVVVGIPSGMPVFPLPSRGADMLKVDLVAAGIPYRDSAGLVFDFHSLRCQCATLADQAGVSPRVAQEFMRHSTLELTGRYTRPRMHDVEGAIESLPSLRPDPPVREAESATGTDGPISTLCALNLPYAGDGSGRNLSVADVLEGQNPHMTTDCKSLGSGDFGGDCRTLAGTDASSGGGIRTPDTRIMIPLAA